MFFLVPDSPITSAFSALDAGLIFSSALVWHFFLGSDLPKTLPFFLKLQNYWRECSASASDVLRSLLPDFLFFSSVTKKFSWDIFPDI